MRIRMFGWDMINWAATAYSVHFKSNDNCKCVSSMTHNSIIGRGGGLEMCVFKNVFFFFFSSPRKIFCGTRYSTHCRYNIQLNRTL